MKLQPQLIDKSFEEFEKFYFEFEKIKDKDISESDTRSKILDYLIKNILGWGEDEINREGYVKEGYFDYEIRSSNFNFIVEAKKNLVDFALPTKGNQAKLKSIYSSNKDIIDQIRGYIFERGLQYGVISNGHQFIIGNFVSHIGGDWKDNVCIFYKNLEDLKSNFINFYNLISKEAINKNGRIKIISDQYRAKSISTSKQLQHFGEKLNRNRISQELIPILSRFFEEIYKMDSFDNKILKECYVENEDIKKFSSELTSIFVDQPPQFDERIVPVQNTRNTQNQIKADIFREEYTPDPVVLIGTAGAGKTSFILNFVQNAISDREKKKRPIIYIDFIKFTKQNIYDTNFIYNYIVEKLKDVCSDLNLHKRNILDTVYKKEIKENKESLWSHLIGKDDDKIEALISEFLKEAISHPINHLEKLSNYLNKYCGRKICLIFDNADQLKEEEQREIFLLAHSIKRNLNCIVITSLREGYFYRWRDKPPFNAYHSTVYHITAPPYREVLEKRINFILNHFEFEQTEIKFDNKSIDFEKGSLKTLFINLYKTLFKDYNSEILQFLEETSYPNIRDGLEKFQTFLLSGHTHVTEYMSLDYGKGDRRGVPFWEFLKSVALDSNYYYNSNDSKVVNLFSPINTNTNHFTKIRILLYLRNEVLASGKDLFFISASNLIGDFIRVGYSTDIILDELNFLHNKNLIYTTEYSSDVEEEVYIDQSSKLSISTIGNYYITSLIKQSTYIELCVVDTPIYNEGTFERLSYIFPESDKNGNRDLAKRAEVTREFIKYLSAMENIDLNRPIDDNEKPALSFKILDNIKKHVLPQLARIERFLGQK